MNKNTYKRIAIILVLLLCSCLISCTNKTTVSSIDVSVSKDYGKVIELAKMEFSNVFNEYENIHIEETSTMARTDEEDTVVVQIRYTSSQGDGVYGFEYSLEDYANPELIQHGENVTIDSLLE